MIAAAVAVVVPWSVDDAVRWVPVAIVPVAGAVGAVICLRALRPSASRGDAVPDGSRVAAGRDARVTALLVANVIVAVALLPAAWALLVVIGGP